MGLRKKSNRFEELEKLRLKQQQPEVGQLQQLSLDPSVSPQFDPSFQTGQQQAESSGEAARGFFANIGDVASEGFESLRKPENRQEALLAAQLISSTLQGFSPTAQIDEATAPFVGAKPGELERRGRTDIITPIEQTLRARELKEDRDRARQAISDLLSAQTALTKAQAKKV